MDMSRYQTLFLSDSGEHLQALEGNLLALEEDPRDRESLNEAFRHLHSLKGLAASMHYEAMARLAHRLEDLASEARGQERGLAAEAVEVMLQGQDVLRAQLQAIRQGQSLPPVPEELVLALEKLQGTSQPPPPPAPVPAPALRPATVRVGTELLDFFFDSVGELFSLLSFFEEYAAANDDSTALRHGVRRLGQVVRRLRERVVQVRMVPVALLTARLPRVVRDLARQQDKQVEFVVSGQEVELDRAIVEALDVPLLHLLRNAVDHGLESAAQRRAAGKPAAGRLELSFQRSGERVQVLLRDDGRGIDLERVWQRARQQGLLPDSETRPEQRRLLELLFQPGFSTREQAGQVSGRGVGLDAVRRDLERLGGRVTVESLAGQGTSFFMDLPLTLAIVPVLLVEEAGALLALPAQRVERVQAGEDDGERVMRLADILGGESAAPAGECLVLGGPGGTVLRLGVEHICSHREVVVKPAGRLLAAVGPYSGAAVLGDGRPALVLDVDELLRRGSGR